jgi:hypothetical protein
MSMEETNTKMGIRKWENVNRRERKIEEKGKI